MAVAFLDFSNRHCVAESTNLLATHWGKHIKNLRVPENEAVLDNGVIVARGKYADDEEDDVYPMTHTGVVFTGIIEQQAANGSWVVCVEEAEDGKAYLVLQVPMTYYEFSREAMDEAQFFNKAGDVVRSYQLAYDDRFTLSKEGFTTEPTTADIGKTVTVDAATGKLVIG